MDVIAAKLIFDGFLAYGWTESELTSTHTQLTHQLRQYISFSSTEDGTALDYCESSTDEQHLTAQSAAVDDDATVIQWNIPEAFDDTVMEGSYYSKWSLAQISDV